MISKSQKTMIKAAVKHNKLQLACYLALLGNADNGSVVTDDAYSDVKEFITPNQWAGYLSSLKAEGKYVPSSEGWGRVK